MSALRIVNLSFAFLDTVPLLADVNLHLAEGWTGLVGENGAGKTSLLRLISGDLRPDAGHVRREPAAARIRVCPQTVEHADPELSAFAAASDALSCRLRGQLDLRGLDRWPTLSPGERKRWQIGAALADEPDILLLDEPSNHLDAAARALLVDALARFQGIGVVVSHDRALLAELTTSTVRVHRGAATLYAGAWEKARAAWEAEEHALIAAHERARAQQRHAEKRLADARRDHAGAVASTSTSRRMKDRYDNDARGSLAKGRADMAERGLGRQVSVARRDLDRLVAIPDVAFDKAVGRSLFVDFVRAPNPWLTTLQGPLQVGEHTLRVDLGMRREDRIRIEGPNGAGKTTLIRALLAEAKVPRDKILYVPQDLSAAEEGALLREVRTLPEAERGRVMQLVAALGVDPGRLLGSERPSPGEARKLMIAMGLGRHVWALALDEPTNHLDLPSIDRLSDALIGYPGALLLVTHDDDFARAATTTSWRLDGRTIVVSSIEAA